MKNAYKLRVHIRWMIRRDMPEVLQLDQESNEPAWPEEDFLKSLRQRNCIGMVAEHQEKVVGFMIYELHKAKLELLRLGVGEAWRRQGVATQMMDKLVSKLSSHRRTRICMDVTEHDTAKHLFFKSAGWRATSVTRRNGPKDEDTYRFVYRIKEDVPTVTVLS